MAAAIHRNDGRIAADPGHGFVGSVLGCDGGGEGGALPRKEDEGILVQRDAVDGHRVDGKGSGVAYNFAAVTFHDAAVLAAVHVHGGGCRGIVLPGGAGNIGPGFAAIGALLPPVGKIAAGGGHSKGSGLAHSHSHVFRLGGDGRGLIVHRNGERFAGAAAGIGGGDGEGRSARRGGGAGDFTVTAQRQPGRQGTAGGAPRNRCSPVSGKGLAVSRAHRTAGQAFGSNHRSIFHRTCYFVPADKGAAIYIHRMAACIQAGPVSDGQALALANGDVLLQGHIAVHGAGAVVKDNAAGFTGASCGMNLSRRITRNSTGNAVGPHDGVAAEGHCGCAGAGGTGAKLHYNPCKCRTAASRGQTAAIHRQ